MKSLFALIMVIALSAVPIGVFGGDRGSSGTYRPQQVGKVGIQGLGFGEILFDTRAFDGSVPVTSPEFETYAPLWTGGTITALTGLNAGTRREIVVGLPFEPYIVIVPESRFRFPIGAGDRFTITMGNNR